MIAPSILSADFARLDAEIQRIPDADWIHVDVMDGHFVPNLTIGAPVAKAIKKVTDKPLDCHLMIEDPGRWVGDYVDAGASNVTFHVEATNDPVTIARKLRESGCGAGLTLKPGTPAENYLEMVSEFDLVLIMSVEPGFGGQSFMADQMPKVRAVRESIRTHGGDVWVQVDGGVSAKTIEQCAEAGADTFVAGSAVYGAESAAAAIDELRDLASRHAH